MKVCNICVGFLAMSELLCEAKLLFLFLQPISWKNVAIVFTIGGMIALWIRNLRQKKELGNTFRGYKVKG